MISGIPEELIDEFTSGFPENWEELIREHLYVYILFLFNRRSFRHDEEMARRRQSMNTATTIDTERDEEEERRTARRRSVCLHFVSFTLFENVPEIESSDMHSLFIHLTKL